jgi:hypothetical protein
MSDDNGKKGPIRAGWEFSFKVYELAQQCKEHAANHRDHAAYWELKVGSWDQEMNASAKIEEVAITGGVQRVLRYDDGLQRKVTDARSRRDNHKARAEDFERWTLALEKADSQDSFRLRIDDVAFFFAPMEAIPTE